MASKFLSLEGLKESIGSKNHLKAVEVVDSICAFFDEDLTTAELALALEVLFDEQSGTIGFLNKTINERKLFKTCNGTIFELWSNLLRNKANEVSFDAYTENIISTCKIYLLSTMVSAKEKERSAVVLQEIFKNKLVNDIDVSDLVNNLMAIFNLKKKTSTVLQQVYKLLGTIARDAPESIMHVMNPDLLRDAFLKPLETTLLNEETIQYNTLTGALEGLSLFMVNFAPNPDEDVEICNRIYILVKRLSDPLDSSKKTMFRASLDLFSNHSTLLSHQIFKDFNFWHSCLTKWLSSPTYEDRRRGIYATNALHRVIASEILSRKDDNDRDILRIFMNHFRSVLESTKSRSYEIRIAIRGFGLMAAPCKKLLPEMLQGILLLVIQRTELITIVEDNELRNSLEHFPDYIEALSQIIEIIADKHAIQMIAHNIENIAIRLIRDFHYLSRAHTQLAVNSLAKSFYNLSEIPGTLLDDVLEKVILQGVIWTSSHKLVYDSILDWQTDIDWKDNITYKSYFLLWEGLLIDTAAHSFDKPMVSRKVFNHLMKTLFLILEKLDLRTMRRVFTDEDGTDKEFYFCDPNIDLCPIKPKDFHIFFNIVDFYREIFWVKFRSDYFLPWIEEFCVTMMRYAIKNPLVSGFLKLLEVGLVKANFLQYFNDTFVMNIHSLNLQLCHFLKNLIAMCQRVSGELQISCTELILKYPCQFYEEYIINLIPIFEAAFDLGKSMIWLAKLAIGTLEKISDCYSESLAKMRKFYSRILPCLDSYLKSKGFEHYVNPEIIRYKNKRRIKKNTVQKVTETDLVVLQKRIISFLGKLNSQIAALMIANKEKSNLVKWDIEQSIRVVMHLPTMRPSIFLDTIMARVCELSVNSSDRKTKIAACELVHAVILYLLGTRKYKGPIWKELCNCMLILGADGDATVQQMFEPILMQIMHFMSKVENLNEGVEILMEALMNGISNSTNCSVRDLSAICLREFVEWSIKQTTPQQLAASPVSLQMILGRLKMYSFDMDGSKRNGAALAFNNLYRKLREEESICDVFFIDLLHIFCVNFKLTEEFSISLTDNFNSELEQVSLSLDHIVRVLKERNALYNRAKPNRNVPAVMGSGTLKDVVLFLIRESGSKLMSYRQKCIEMTEMLAPCVSSAPSFAAFLTKYTTADMLREVCEGTPDGVGIQARSTLEILKNDTSQPHSMLYSWLQHFLSSLDCYSWLLSDNDLLKPEELFHNAKIFDVISYYLNRICWKDIDEILHENNSNASTDTSDTIKQIKTEDLARIETIKTIIVVRIIDVLAKIHQADCAGKFPLDFWTKNKTILKQFIVQVIYEPHKLNFDFRSEEIAQKLPQRIENLIRSLRLHCIDKEFVRELQSKIVEILQERFTEIGRNTPEILSSDSVAEEQLNTLRGINFVCQKLTIFTDEENTDEVRRFLKSLSIQLFSDLFLGIKQTGFENREFTIQPVPSVQGFANRLMGICFIVNALAPNVVHCLLDMRLLRTTSGAHTITHGEHFFAIYKRTIFEQCNEAFIQNVITRLLHNINAQNFHQILKFFTELSDFMCKYKAKDLPSLRKLVDIILTSIPKILESAALTNDNLIFIKIMSHVANASPYPLHMFREKAPALEKWILDRLTDSTNSLENKSRIIFLLALIVGPDDKEHPELSKALEDVQRQHFPLLSNEFAQNSIEETALKSVFKSLLHSLVASRSYVILEFLVKCTASDKKHIVEWLIRSELETYMKLLSRDQQILRLNRILEITCNTDLEPNVRLNIFDRFLLVMIHNSQETSLCDFYSDKIKKINEMIETNYGSGKSGWAVEQALSSRIIGYSLVETMFACLPKSQLISRVSTIVQNFVGEVKTGTEMVGTFTKKAFYARTEVFVTDDSTTAELFRVYQCAAYRCVCALVSNTQGELKFYSKFIFEENLTKNELIWQKLIDCSNDRLYAFDGQEAQDYPKIKDRFTSIRKLNKRGTTNKSQESTLSSRHLQTQNVFGSSLSQDVTQLDLTHSTVRTDAEAFARTEQYQDVAVAVRLERHVLNKHEVMPILCGVVQHIFENEIAPVPLDPESRRPYSWITAIATALENTEYHKNIRIFLAQMVENCRNVFQHYSYALFRPILQFLVDECAGNELNFFVTDLVAMVLSWSYKPTTPEEIRLTSSLLKYLMRNAWHENKKILKLNLEIIQAVINKWKDVLSLPCQLILDMISKSQRPDSTDNSCGIILLGIALSNEMVPWTDSTKNFFIRGIFSNLWNDYTMIYQPAANVMGMILNRLKSEQDNALLEDILPELVNKIKACGTKNEKKLLDLIYGIQKHYPEIIDSFREIISFRLPLAVGAIKCIYLEMFLTRIEAYEADGMYRVLISIGIKDVLKNLAYQYLGLHILNRAIRKMEESDVVNLFSLIEECVESRKFECRDITYEILIYIALTFSSTLGIQAGQLLLKGLMDTDSKIQNRIFHFWSHEANLSDKIDERLIFLISDYSVKCEKQFLGFCTQLLLQLSIEHPESKEKVFEFESDHDSKLLEYQINTKSRIKSTHSLPPLFAESQNTRRSLLTGTQDCNYIRETGGEYFFEPTQDPVKIIATSQSFTLPTQSSLPFVIQPQVLDRRSRKISSQEIAAGDDDLDKSFNRLRRRFLKDKETEKRDQALKIIDYRTRIKRQMETEIKKKEDEVVLYRRYRNGDYPDLLINNLALLLPLQGLVKRDSIIARQIFVSIFGTILDALGPESKMFVVSISSKIQTLLETTKTCDPMIFATFLEIALLRPAQFDFSPDIIAMISKASNMLTIGAIYLECRINADWDTDAISAKTSSSAAIDEQHWLHLSSIYNLLAEYDVVAAIFSDKMRTDPRLAEAIELKANGRYQDAQDLLLQVIERRVEIEHHYAYICYYECFLEMGMWSELSKTVQNQVDDLEELWTDDYNFNHILPHLFQSEVQLVLQDKSKNNDFLRILESWIVDPVKAEHIKTMFCEELMMLHIANRDFLQARVYCERYLKTFVIDWGIISSLNYKLRMKNLLNAQKVAEIDHYALLLIQNFDEAAMERLNSRWEKCVIQKSDSLQFWNCVIAYRSYIAYLISDMLGNLNGAVMSVTLEDTVCHMQLQLLESALYQKNYGITDQILRQLHPNRNCRRNNFHLQYKIANMKKIVLESQQNIENERIGTLKQAWTMSQEILNNADLKDDVKLNLQALTLHTEIGENLLDSISVRTLNTGLQNDFITLTSKSTAEGLHQRIFDQSLWSLLESTKITSDIVPNLTETRSLVSSSFYRLAQFCYDHRDDECIDHTIETDQIIIKFVFLAMKSDSKEARQLFPCILQLSCIEDGTLHEYFQSCSSDVPEWMFLAWIPQILSRLDFYSACYLDDVVKRIAIAYPNALVFPFRVWYGRYIKQMKTNDFVVRSEIQEISNILQNPLTDKFIDNFECLCLPESLLLSYLNEFSVSEETSQERYIFELEEVIDSVFIRYESIQGGAYHSIQKFKKPIENLKLLNIENDFQKIRDMIGNIRATVKQALEKFNKKILLDDISPWLSRFQWCGEESCLELPDQYDGDYRPKILENVKIVKFGQKIHVFRSLRRPLRITVYGSNAKTYDFLVKHGEDLKQDQRIQQILRLMSEKLTEDRDCRNHNMFIRTFKVIPIGQNCGMLSWVFDTIALETFMMDTFIRKEPNAIEKIRQTSAAYDQFIKNAQPEGTAGDLHAYGRAATFYTRDQLIANFRNLENAINPEILRCALVDISVSPESFYALRNNFATSLAAMSIGHWILGIGDRHLLNILMNTKDGTLTGIDFGVTFGAGARNLFVPELTPFRLTPHMVQAMMPMGTSGIIFKCMANALRVFRDSKRVLMACMEIFVQEPTVNWLKPLRLGGAPDADQTEQAAGDWKPKARIEIAKRKLLGHNPMHLLEKELRAGVLTRFPEYLEGYIRILKGVSQFNIRARLPEENLTVEQQVKCLIDMATDPAVLNIAYIGFLPWM